MAFGRGLRRLLDGLYLAGGMLAALALVSILAIIVAQMVARWTGLIFPGAASYAGYAMASASFFAFAHALNRGAHIRVSILLNALGSRRRWLEVWCFGIGAALTWYLSYYAIKAVYWSHKLHDVSQGQDATPLWIPQSAMAAGAVLLAIAMTDHLVRVLVLGSSGIVADTVEQSHGE
ncbi:TRAP transporter small permease subunit [Stappia indica]|uniref:TRAP transporter small permease protein n=1 Tax=Stappia indica TaxID=538381 RepID=A0A857CE08_9HYPH|nr:TRAP transporter small permease subunit [Stappia indica]